LFKDHHAILVGVDKYKNGDSQPIPQLKYASGDARGLRDTLINIGYPSKQVHLLLNEGATFEAIRRTLRALSDSELPDATLILMVWAGHGVSDRRTSRNFLLPWDADLDRLANTAVGIDRLAGSVQYITADVAIFGDTCCFWPSRPDALLAPNWAAAHAPFPHHAVAVVGASTYKAIEAEGRGGILISCLTNLLTDPKLGAGDPLGVIRLRSIMRGLKERLDPEASAEWAREYFDPSPQIPYFFEYGTGDVPLGLDRRGHIEGKAREFPESAACLVKIALEAIWPRKHKP
jgi:hypothetical protein